MTPPRARGLMQKCGFLVGGCLRLGPASRKCLEYAWVKRLIPNTDRLGISGNVLGFNEAFVWTINPFAEAGLSRILFSAVLVLSARCCCGA